MKNRSYDPSTWKTIIWNTKNMRNGILTWLSERAWSSRLVHWSQKATESLNLLSIQSTGIWIIRSWDFWLGILFRLSNMGLTTLFRLCVLFSILSTNWLWLSMEFLASLLSMPQFYAIDTTSHLCWLVIWTLHFLHNCCLIVWSLASYDKSWSFCCWTLKHNTLFYFLLLQWRRLHLRKVDVFQAWFKVAVSVIDLGCPEVQLVLISWIGISRYANIYIFFYR